MMLAHRYAELFKSLTPDSVLAYMKSRGHLSLLPRIVRIMEREQPAGTIITIARESDRAQALQAHPGAQVVIDPHIVGGMSVRTTSAQLTDRTYRSALVTLYKRITA